MKTVYAGLDSENRIDGATYREDCAGQWQSYEVPDEFDMASARDWVLVDGVMTYDPMPQPEPEPSLDQRVTDVETQLTALGTQLTALGTQLTAADAKADEAKTTADTAAASVNEYMDALLGLDATNETEATDAE